MRLPLINRKKISVSRVSPIFISKIGIVSDSVLDEIKIGLTKVLSIWNDNALSGLPPLAESLAMV